MAKKVLDTKSGNPYHNESSGQFTSPDDNGEEKKAMELMNLSENSKENNVERINFPHSMAANKVLLEANRLAQQEEYEEKGLEIGDTIDDCRRICDQLLTVGKCTYSNELHIDFANEFNQALFDFKNDFGGILDSVIRYGDDVLDTEKILEIRKKGNENIDKLIKNLNIGERNIKVEKITSYLNSLNDWQDAARGKAKGNTLGYTSLGSVGFMEGFGSERYNMIKSLSQGGFSEGYAQGSGLSVVVFNTKNYSNNSSFLNSNTKFNFYPAYNKDDIISSFHYPNEKGYAYGTASHELGHRVDMVLCLNHMSKEEIEKRTSLLRNIRKAGTSKYAFADFLETAAEAFADVYSNKTPTVKENLEYVNYMKTMYKKYFNNGGE